MKALLYYLTTALILATAHSASADTFLKATVSGTVQTQVLLSITEGRIHTAVLNNKRIFQEFQVSPQDYELVVAFQNELGLVLLPKLSSSGLPTIAVVGFDSLSSAIDTKARVFKFQSPVAMSTATNLFQDLTGQIDGSIHYKGPFPPTIISATAFTVTATGTDTSSAGNGSALLKFKVTTQGPFVQH